jgi:imidazole glycerol-phosphate synthase subunit HisH
MSSVAIVDYKLCNLDSIARAVQDCGGNARVTDEPKDLAAARAIILPGVGTFPDAMRYLRQRGLADALTEQVLGKKIPFLGICLGMQLLATWGHEIETTQGLGWLDAEVRRFQPKNGERVPHVGWNEVWPQADCPLFRGITPGKDFYFVHSFHVCPADAKNVAANTPYCNGFVSAVQRELVFGVQFHPEKSQRLGFQMLRNFLAL